MNSAALLGLAIGGLFATGFAAMGARSLRDFSRHELEAICRRRNALNRLGEILQMHERVALGVESLRVAAATLLVVTATFWVQMMWDGQTDGRLGPLLLSGLVLGVILAAAIVWIPWAFARLWAESFLCRTWRIWRMVSTLMTPFVWFAELFDALMHRLSGRTRDVATEESLEDEIRTIVTEGHREGLLEEDAREMIEGVIELGDADVSEIMTPRTDVHMMHVGLSWDESVNYVIVVGHTRIPVYDKSRDDVIGILHSKDLLPELAKSRDQRRRSLSDILRKPYFVPETKAVDVLLQQFQQTRNHIAVVLDEYGGVSGLVTLEDVIEEIVGEIVDEYDQDVVEPIQRIDESTCEAMGRAHVDEINQTMGLDLPEDGDFDTIGGFVFSELGRIPTPGELMEWHDAVRITVLEASRRRIDRVRLERLGQRARESA